jgi:predicted O-linked N-acetylglucosamine transferase (SPINDLY family)
VTWLAYCSTTGVETIDYRLTDPHIDPPGKGDENYSEKSLRLPESWWCYEPAIATPEAGKLPALSNGWVTFGCLNNFAKLSGDTLMTWSRILREIPQSRLVLHAKEGSHLQRALNLFQQEGITLERIQFVPFVGAADYYRRYDTIDIALDPFPCAGGTTTCDALWMGVPVITLGGKTAVGRTGVSILTNVGLAKLVTQTTDQYVRLAVSLTKDVSRLVPVRAALRNRMKKSPLCDAPRFAKNIEAAFRQMWREWCEGARQS